MSAYNNKIGARVQVIAKTFGLVWATHHHEDVNEIITGTIARKTYQNKNNAV